MRTRSQSRNSNRQQQQVNPTFVEPFNLVEPIENQAPPVVTMDDTRTMAQLLEAPTVGYEDAIVVPEITVDNFELKHGLLTLVQNKQFFGHDKEDPHAHIRYFNKITSTMKFPNVPSTSLDKFEGVNFRKWHKKMHFLLSNMSVVGLILNGMSDPLFDIYQNVESSKELWDSLEVINMVDDASSKKFLVSNLTNYKMTDSRPVMVQYNELFGILGRFTQHKMNMDEAIQLSLPELTPTCMTLELADRSITQSIVAIPLLIMTRSFLPLLRLSLPGDSDFLLEEVDAFLALEDDPTSPEVDDSYYDPEADILLLESFPNDDPSLPPPT
ncbi:hypothetical protein Tco_1244820 [Tanacetum coccineum]